MGHGNHRKGNIVTPGFECNAQKVDYFDATIRIMYRNVTLLYFWCEMARTNTPGTLHFNYYSYCFQFGIQAKPPSSPDFIS